MQIKVAASILSADFSSLKDVVQKLQNFRADIVHLDIMDGNFVPPITFGPKAISDIRKLCYLPFDAHLMVEHPKTHIESFAKAHVDNITVHYEACKKLGDDYLRECLEMIRSYGIDCGVAINPETPVEAVFDMLPLVNTLLIMSVNPGYGGQTFIPSSFEKIRKAKEWIDKYKLYVNIEVDGGINEKNCQQVLDAGGNILVAGSAIYTSEDKAYTIKKLHGRYKTRPESSDEWA